mgnify:CR=1 FL=1
MTFQKLGNGAIIEYNNGYTVKFWVEGNKLKMKEELNGKPTVESVFYLSDDQARQLKEALKKAQNAEDVLRLLQGVRVK